MICANNMAAGRSFTKSAKENLAQYLDLGLNLIKIGEEGRVLLPEFP